MKFLTGLAASILVLTIPAPAQTADPTMTKAERAELIELLNKSEKEFLQAVEGLSEQQWSFKPGPSPNALSTSSSPRRCCSRRRRRA
jgi:hypothetical protein